ncbi:D-alanyl-D-alanine carboxypeptidase family protein [Metasolibacillus sp. FSL H7-0170]|uniref:D-alanyl-D-alanine carboxypeptidase family protein n=1 Tax=unclassified Metasolibacillus TaxID=2703679 RepID=UPI00079BAF1C|nr:D-alanyl-D-alanine carboxypeptidase [[Bacillus] sp. KCTC 13219]
MKKWLCVVLLFVLLQPSAQAAGHAYAVIDAQTGRMLMGANEHVRLPIASLTKIWTALIVLENSELHDKVTISERAALSEGSSIYLEKGQTYSIETLLYGLMLRSGNDAAYALAEHVGGSVEGFVYLMNERAQLAGLSATKFSNPSGLHNEEHLSSAYDTARMLQIAMRNEQFKKIASTVIFNGEQSWKNKHRLLSENNGAVAGKTGYTKVAGRTLATYFQKEQKHFIVVTLNESNDWRVHTALADHIASNYAERTLAKKGIYTVAGEKITVNEPIKMLVTKAEVRDMQHVVYLPTDPHKKEAIWYVYDKGRPVHAVAVQRE